MSALDFCYYAEGFAQADAWSSNNDEADLDDETLDWLFMHDWL